MASGIGFSQTLSRHYLRHSMFNFFFLAVQAGFLASKDLKFWCNTVIFNFLIICFPFQHHFTEFFLVPIQCFNLHFHIPPRILDNRWSCWGIHGLKEYAFQCRAGTTQGGGFSFCPIFIQVLSPLSLGNFYLDIQLKHFPKFLWFSSGQAWGLSNFF